MLKKYVQAIWEFALFKKSCFLALLGLHCCLGFSLVAECGLLNVVASLAAQHRL